MKQSDQASRQSFEVASVKPCIPSGRGPAFQWSPGRLTVYCQPAAVLIAWSYIEYEDGASRKLSPSAKMTAELAALTSPVEGEPSWVKSESFTVSAEVPGDASQEMMMGPMMQQLLEDRFNLKSHWATREGLVYNLIVAKSGPKLPQTDTSFCRAIDAKNPTQPVGPPNTPNCVMQLKEASMADLAKLLSAPFGAGQPVIDKTGITGTFSIQLLYAPQFVPPGSTDAPTILEAVKHQLGLELVPAQGPHQFLVIDHIEEPTPN